MRKLWEVSALSTAMHGSLQMPQHIWAVSAKNCRIRQQLVSDSVQSRRTRRSARQMLDGTLGVFAERIGRQLFKLAVEQNVNNHILASDTDIDAARYMKMHTLSMDQVRGTNGKISFVDVLQQEKACNGWQN